MVDVGFAERAVARQRFVDRLVERRIVAGRVGVPDFEMARRSRLPKRPDLTKSNFRERHRAFVFVRREVMLSAPPAGVQTPRPTPIQGNGSGGVVPRPRLTLFHSGEWGVNAVTYCAKAMLIGSRASGFYPGRTQEKCGQVGFDSRSGLRRGLGRAPAASLVQHGHRRRRGFARLGRLRRGALGASPVLWSLLRPPP